MSLHRVGLMAITTLFTAGMTSMAFAGCCGWGVQAQPVVYAASGYAGGCGGCGTSVVYAAPSGCGGCGTAAYAAPITYAAPVAYGSGCGGCGSAVVAPAAIYVVNQGPEYAGNGLSVPYRTYSPSAYAAPANEYPYMPGYAEEAPRPRYHHVYRGPRVVYRDRVIYRDRYMPMPHMHPYHRPLGARG
jgi:hypothetical protein